MSLISISWRACRVYRVFYDASSHALIRFLLMASFILYCLRLKMSNCSLTRHATVSRRIFGFSLECYPPIFLAPLTASMPQSLHQRSSFSTTASLSARSRKKRDGNPHRGESALRRTGIKYPTGMSVLRDPSVEHGPSKRPLPQPVLDPAKRSGIKVDPNHGLWGFFDKDRKGLTEQGVDMSRGMLKSLSATSPTNWYRSLLDCGRTTA